MTHMNMTVEIDVLADDSTPSKEWVENVLVSQIVDTMKGLFKYPISLNVELQELLFYDDEQGWKGGEQE